jgi:NitT/TauT family transport system substrate-binding protein
MRCFCLGLVVAAALALPFVSGAQAGDAQTLETVRVAAFPLDVTGNIFYAYDLGLFQKAGLDVQFVTVTSGAVVGQAVVSGTIDIGTTNVVSIALAHQSGIPFVIIAPSGASSAAAPLEAIVVAKNSPYKTAKDLEGKTAVISVLQGILQTEADAWMDKHGADPRTVKWIEAPAHAQAAVVESGRVDFGAITEPFVTAAVNDGNSRILGYIGPEVSRLLVEGGYFCTVDYAKMHPATVKKFRDALMVAGRWANAHPDDATAILAKYTKGPPTPGAHRAVFLNRFRASDIQPLIDSTAKYGGLKSDFRADDFVIAN